MQTAPGPDAGVRNTLSGALRAASRAPGIGTEHLLVALAGAAGRTGSQRGAAEVLDEFGVTPVPLTDVLRQQEWTATDEATPDAETGPLGDLERFGKKRNPVSYTGAARAALHHAIATAAAAGRTEFHAGDLLDALLAAPNRAVEMVERSGADPRRVRDRLAGGPAPDPAPAGLAPDLHPTLDRVLGRARYRSGGFTSRMAHGILQATGGNLARTPVPWADSEAREQADRLGHPKVRTAHLLLALLAMEEVIRHAPHLAAAVAERYSGAVALVEAGATYAAARAALAGEPPGDDPRRYKSYVDGRRDTTDLVAAILDGNTSASRLLAALGVAKPDLS
jgi:hypothetical protein